MQLTINLDTGSHCEIEILSENLPPKEPIKFSGKFYEFFQHIYEEASDYLKKLIYQKLIELELMEMEYDDFKWIKYDEGVHAKAKWYNSEGEKEKYGVDLTNEEYTRLKNIIFENRNLTEKKSYYPDHLSIFFNDQEMKIKIKKEDSSKEE